LALGAFAQPNSDVFPDFTATDIDGVEHTLSDYLADDKIVVIDVFATWCGICINSLPGLHELEELYPDDVVLLSFESDPGTTNESQFITQYNITNPVFPNSTSLIQSWNVPGQPRFFVICPDGSFQTKVGGIGSNPAPLDDYVDTCLDSVVSVEETTEALDFNVVVNPVRETLSIRSSDLNATYEVYGLTSELYLKGTLENEQTNIVANTLGSGIYFVKVNSGGKELVKRFVKL